MYFEVTTHLGNTLAIEANSIKGVKTKASQ